MAVPAETGWYRLNDNAANTVVLDEVAANNGVATANTSTISQAGIVGTALNFSTGKWVTLPESAGDEITASGSICWWAHRTATSGSNMGMIGLGSSGARKIWAFEGSVNNLQVGCYDVAGNPRTLTATANDLDAWVHWAITFATPNLVLFRNGEIADTDAFAGTPDMRGANVNFIGYIQGFGAWGGLMDDVRFFSEALSQDQVSVIFNGGAGTPKSLAAAMRKPLASILRQMGA